jgi:hypothetical protein
MIRYFCPSACDGQQQRERAMRVLLLRYVLLTLGAWPTSAQTSVIIIQHDYRCNNPAIILLHRLPSSAHDFTEILCENKQQ